MPEQIKIDIPEGKTPIMEQTENGIVITWKEKELTYDDVLKELQKSSSVISSLTYNSSSNTFHKKVQILRKLTNIRNYFGKPSKSNKCGWVVGKDGSVYASMVEYPHFPVFDKKEHAEQAIKILGDELKYLFEPW